MQKGTRKVATERSPGGSSVTVPRVTRVTPEGRLLYDPLSVIRSGPARKHLKELEEKNPATRDHATP